MSIARIPDRVALCPDCGIALAEVTSGSTLAHRCGRCRGLWLDPASFQRLCEGEAKPRGGGTGLARAGDSPNARAGESPNARAAATPIGRVRYRACPRCGEIMDRRNFGRVSGVVIDICRPHGAWFDRGKLADIRRFLRTGGLGRYERTRRLARERTMPSPVAGGGGPIGDLYDILMGDSGWNVPRRFPRLLAAAIFGTAGGWLVWLAFRSTIFGRPLGVDTLGVGLVALYFGWRALVDWAQGRSR